MKPEDLPNFVKRDECPACFEQVDCASNTSSSETAKAGPGGVSICFSCGALLVFDEGLNLGLATDDDREKLTAEQRDRIAFFQVEIGKRKRSRPALQKGRS